MKRVFIFIFLLLTNLTNSGESHSKDDFPVVESPYLGQKPPGLIPEIFAPDIIKTDFREAAAAFTPDLKEFYFRRRGGEYKNNTLVVIKYKNNRWHESVVAPRAGEPFISPDGKILHLGNNYRERTNSGWSELKDLGAPFKGIPIMRLSVSSEGTYYFDEATSSGLGTIQYSLLIEGNREKPRALGKEINTGKWTAHPFSAPEETYLIWDCERENGYGDNDLYISFRQKDGSWGAAINMGDEINTALEENSATVTPDGKYIFFNRYPSSGAYIYWVDAQIIETLKPI